MKLATLLLPLLVAGCELSTKLDLKPDECVLGDKMLVWKYQGKVDGKHRFIDWNQQEGAGVRDLEDLSALKKVDCPTSNP